MKEKDGCSPEKDTCEQKPFMERAVLVQDKYGWKWNVCYLLWMTLYFYFQAFLKPIKS